ncbi:hypothetical protein AB4Z39_16860, partial [Mycobacterium adipatum]|uniref:hypothetical protein n=1 Tax=Mycobacterium adipatum TaxID=1682113 RepID=UPI0034E0A723
SGPHLNRAHHVVSSPACPSGAVVMNDLTIITLVAITVIVPCLTAAFIVHQTGTTDGIADILHAIADIARALTPWGD